jgi:serine/threonine-protein kinase RsbT
MQAVSCAISRDVDVYMAISHGREISQYVGLSEIDRTKIEIAILELTRNILAHARCGCLIIEPIIADQRRGVAIEARDNGPGIPDIDLAMRDGYSTAHTLGAGLPGVQRLMDEFFIESTVGVGTVVRAVKWFRPRPGYAPYRRR